MYSFDNDCSALESYGIRYIYSKGFRNQDNGVYNLDNVLLLYKFPKKYWLTDRHINSLKKMVTENGFVIIFSMATLEGRSDIFTYVSKTFKDKIYINPIIVFAYFHFFIFLSLFYMLKLFLAVTNAEYEHIEVSRRELTEKKSFYKLIQNKYDIKMKEKLEKKRKRKTIKGK